MKKDDPTILTPAQMRMARAALGMTLRQLGKAVKVDPNAISRYETGASKMISYRSMEKLALFFRSKRIYFGPNHGVCVGQDTFAAERWFSTALYRILAENGINPSTDELIKAGKTE